jgi:Zn-dependent peptidase ImmA (M78 family)/transcriptional regulator with XRE-family HTH domain
MKPVQFAPDILQWARQRARLEVPYLAHRMKVSPDAVQEWETTGQLTLAKAKKLAQYTLLPLGYLFLKEPIKEVLPIPDFRTLGDSQPEQPGPNLLDTVQIMEQRQSWMREFLIEEGVSQCPFVGSARITDKPEVVAAAMREALKITSKWAHKQKTWEDALRHLRMRIEEAGILIFINGIVGNNTHRALDPEEFRGFVLSDEYAPLIFINGTDAKSAQMFTMAHELAHVWIGQGGVSNLNILNASKNAIEQFCNAIAAEFLVPAHEITPLWLDVRQKENPYEVLAKYFKVSPIVAARRCLELGFIPRAMFFEFYKSYNANENRLKHKKSGGGDFWKTQNVRLGFRFGSAIVIAAREGRLLYRDAYRLSGLNGATFEKYASNLGIPI